MNRIALGFTVVLLAAACLLCAPSRSQQYLLPPWHGQGVYSHGISWSGSVDDTVDVYIQGGHVWEQVDSGKGLRRVDVQVFDELPSQHTDIMLADVRGRGSVSITQQPHRDNGYTAVIRINDPQPGRSYYHFRVIW